MSPSRSILCSSSFQDLIRMLSCPVEKYLWYFGRNPMEIECVQSGNYKKEAEKNVKSPSREILVRFWNKSNGNWMVLESGQSRGAAKLALATSWIDLRKVCQCKSSFWHTAGGIELSHGGLQCIFTMLAADEEKLPALEGFGSPTIIYDSRGTWLGQP